ncbi:MAG TPA: T9SS type A sorting domain-containing protein, partial [Saprospiraceae bacterium]|nr:T9SS type A sorting domain-containing protein [Saprospiraceae bacterium]
MNLVIRFLISYSKKSLLSFCFFAGLSGYGNLFAQTWEFYDQSGSETETILHTNEFIPGQFASITTIEHKNSDNQYHNKSRIRIHYTFSGESINEVIYQIDSLSIQLNWIFYSAETQNFIIIGGAKEIKGRDCRGYFLVTVWDQNLNFISDTLVRLEPYNEFNRFWYLTGNINTENELLVVGYYSDDYDYTILRSKLFICRLSLDGEIQLIKWYKKRYENSSIFYDPYLNRYVMFSSATLFLDENFEIVDSLTTWGSYSVSNSRRGLSTIIDENKYLVTAMYDGFERGIALVDSNLRLIKGVKIDVDPNTEYHVDFGAQNFDFIDTSNIFFGTMSLFLDHYAVSKVNSNLDPYWVKFFSKGDNIDHVIWTISATSDGGCIVSGGKGKYTYWNGNFTGTPWAIKLDENGNTVSTHDPVPGKWEITVFPNPSAGDFRIDIAGDTQDATLMLFDMQGRMLRHYEQLGQGQHTFDFSDLPVGTYIWKLMHKGKALGEDRW